MTGLLHKLGCTAWQARRVNEPKRAKRGYKTTNWEMYNAALKAMGSLTMRLDQDM